MQATLHMEAPVLQRSTSQDTSTGVKVEQQTASEQKNTTEQVDTVERAQILTKEGLEQKDKYSKAHEKSRVNIYD